MIRFHKSNGGIVMETIKERAEEFAQNFEIILKDVDCGGCGSCEKCKDYRRFVDIVTEQKIIDIEKACKWFADYLMEIGYPDDWMRDSSNMLSGEERFRKAMEEQE